MNSNLDHTVEIKNCFDSHVHFLATGQVTSELKLQNLQSVENLRHLKIDQTFFRDNWLVGFGWNEKKWNPSKPPTLNQLDEIFPDYPVFLSRVDGHASVINTKALKLLVEKKLVSLDDSKNFNGLLLEDTHIKALSLLPGYSDQQIESFLKKSTDLFHAGGFTHVRDLSMTYKQWTLQKKLIQQKKINIYCEGFITVESVADLERGYSEYLQCKNSPCDQLRIKGLKIFIDGSLGSKTAYLSANYTDTNNKGLLLWTQTDIEKAIHFSWKNKIEIAIHTIGDEAVHTAAVAAREVAAQGLLGKFHLEHVQIIRPETFKILKPLHVYCHMQPCHWLSDQSWLKQSIGELSDYAFSWEALRKNKINFDFGTDSPIEPANIALNIQALEQSSQKKQNLSTPKLQDDWWKYHQHKDLNWGNGLTQISNGKVSQVILDGVKLILT